MRSRRGFALLALPAAVLLLAGCGQAPAASHTPGPTASGTAAPSTPLRGQANVILSTQDPGAVLNDVNSQLKSIDDQLHETDSGLSTSEGDPSK